MSVQNYATIQSKERLIDNWNKKLKLDDKLLDKCVFSSVKAENRGAIEIAEIDTNWLSLTLDESTNIHFSIVV